MISYLEALNIIIENRLDLAENILPLANCVGKVLREDMVADRDFPPFDRVTMDGIAISYNSFHNGNREFQVERILAAGQSEISLENTDNCIEVMTGAVLPGNTDTVIRYEDLTLKDEIAIVNEENIEQGKNIHYKGLDRKKGDIIVPSGRVISTAEINIAASIGKESLRVADLPRGLIVSTGDEVVDISVSPEAHQIRNSNVHGIRSTLASWGIEADLTHFPDEPEIMHRSLKSALEEYQLLILTGAVSKGKFDHLPQVLEDLGVIKLFHKVRQRPGKPFWFGKSSTGTVVFALPGNPVSSFMCTYVYLREWVAASLGLKTSIKYVVLQEEFEFTPDLTYFLEARIESAQDGTILANPVFGHGSGDFANLVDGDGFLVLPSDKDSFRKGEIYPFIEYRQKF